MWTPISWTADGHRWHEDESQDISRSGILLRTQEHLPQKTMLRLQFRLPGDKSRAPIIADARVARLVHRHDRQVAAGLQFVVLRSQDNKVVHEFVSRIMGLAIEDDQFEALAEQEGDLSAYSMERLLEEADKKRALRADQRLTRETARLRQEKRKLWLGRSKRLILLALLIALATKVYQCMQGMLAQLPKG